MRAYYDHIGDPDLGFAPVPFGWEEESYLVFPIAIESHMCSKYVEWLQYFQPYYNATSNATRRYVDKFERIEDQESERDDTLQTTSLS